MLNWEKIVATAEEKSEAFQGEIQQEMIRRNAANGAGRQPPDPI